MARKAKRLARSPSRERRLERRRLARAAREERRYSDQGRIVCERCGLEQAFRTARFDEELAPCAGPLGLSCAGETAITLERYLGETPTDGHCGDCPPSHPPDPAS